MAGFKASDFRGLRPRIAARKLPHGEAQIAINTKLGSGDLRPWHKPSSVYTLDASNRDSIYLYDNNGSPIWFEWAADVDVALGPVKADTQERVYYTGDGFPKMTYRVIANTADPYPSDWRRLGLLPPAAAAPVVPPSDTPSTVGTTGSIGSSNGMLNSSFSITVVEGGNWAATDAAVPDNRMFLRELRENNYTDVDFLPGLVLSVEVIDANSFRISNPLSEYLCSSPDTIVPELGFLNSDVANLFMITGTPGITERRNVHIHIHNGMLINKTAHGLIDGSLIRVTAINSNMAYRWIMPTTADTSTAEGTRMYFLIDAHPATPYPPNPLTLDCSWDHIDEQPAMVGSWSYIVIEEGDGAVDTVEERAYVYTYVTALGEEGPPSPVSAFVNVVDGTEVTVGPFSTPPGSGDGYDITHIRIYRTNASADPTDDASNFQFVEEVAHNAVSYADSKTNENLGELLPSAFWDRPDPDMRGIVALSNGMMAGFKGKNVYLSEPYFPHAWPAIYDQATDYDIVTIIGIGTSAVILTVGTPYIMMGTHPRNVSIRPYKINQACVSKRSAVEKDDRALYASPDGLIELGIDGYRILTDPYFTKDEWELRNPSTIVAEVHDNTYFAFHTDGGFVFDPIDETVGFSSLSVFSDQELGAAGWTAEGGWSFAGGQAILTDGVVFGLWGGQTDISSVDLVTWLASGDSPWVTGENIAFSPTLGKFMAWRAHTGGKYMESTDCLTWSAEGDCNHVGHAGLSTVRSAEWYEDYELFIFGGESTSDNHICKSADGINIDVLAAGNGVQFTGSHQAYSPTLGLILAFSTSGTHQYYAITDPIAGTWTREDNPINAGTIAGLHWAANVGRFVLLSTNGSVRYSSDGYNWSSASIGANVGTDASAYNPDTGRLFARPHFALNDAGYSDDGGATWTVVTGPNLGQGVVIFAFGGFLTTLGSTGSGFTSPDGITWTAFSRPDLGTNTTTKFAAEYTTYREIVHNTKTAVVPGEVFRVTISVVSSTNAVRAGIAWYNAASELISTVYSEDTVTSGDLSFTAAAPALTAFASPVVSATGDTVISAASFLSPTMDTFLDIENDVLYFTDGGVVKKWEGNEDDNLNIQWKSGQFHMQYPINIGAGIVEADGYPLTFRLYGDGELRATRTVTNDEPFRLPGGYLASTYEIEIEGTYAVTEAKIAESIFELSEG